MKLHRSSCISSAQFHRLAWAIALACALAVLLAGHTHAQSDTTAPVIVEVTLDPDFIDTSTQPVTITVTARITDDLSGVRYATLLFQPELGTTQRAEVQFYHRNRISGTATDGIYQNTMTLPRYAAWGRWWVYYVATEDEVHNYQQYQRNNVELWLFPWYFVNHQDTEHAYLPALRQE